MKINSFLTDIAKSFSPEIEYVAFCDFKDSHLGEVQQRPGRDAYWILIDKNKLPCALSVIFVMFHEVGHVLHGDVGAIHRSFTDWSDTEAKADNWAFHQMGLTDEIGQVSKENKPCYECHKARSNKCLKGLNINPL